MSELSLYRNDGNLVSILGSISQNVGVRGQGIDGLSIQLPDLLTEDELAALYRHSWLARKIVDIYPEDATRLWMKPLNFGEDADPDLPDKCEEYLERLHAAEMFAERDRWCRLYHGGAFLFIGADDGQPLFMPLNEKRIKSIRVLEVFDSYELIPNAGENRFNPEYFTYYPTDFRMNRDLEELGTGTVIHKSRLCTQLGMRTTHRDYYGDRILPSDSRLQSLWSSLKRYTSAVDHSSEMLSDHDLFMHGVTGLADLIAQGKTDNLMKHLQEVWIAREMMNMMIIDKDRESASRLSHNFSGIDKTVAISRDDVTAACDVPHYKIWGSVGKAAGMGENRTEERAWAEQVNTYQHKNYKPDLKRLCDLMFLAKDGPTRGRLPKHYKIEFRSLYTPTPKELAEERQAFAQVDKTNIDSGVYDSDEARQRYYGTEFKTELQLEEREDLEEQFPGIPGGFRLPPDTVYPEDGGQAPETSGDASGTGEGEQGELKEEPQTLDSNRNDDGKRAVYYVNIGGLRVGLQYRPGDERHGRRLGVGYGYIQGSKGADGMAVDVYLGPDLDSREVYQVTQYRYGTKEFDEHKMMLGFASEAKAVAAYKKAMPGGFYGGVETVDWSTLLPANSHLMSSRALDSLRVAIADDKLSPATASALRDAIRDDRLSVSTAFALKEAIREDKRACSKGYSCGDGCITRTKACVKTLSPQQKAIVGKLKGVARVAAAAGLNKANEGAAAAKAKAGELAGQAATAAQNKLNEGVEAALGTQAGQAVAGAGAAAVQAGAAARGAVNAALETEVGQRISKAVQEFRNSERGHKVEHAVAHVGENIAAWKAGKVLGPLVGAALQNAGVHPEMAELLGETAVQGVAATALSMRNSENRTPRRVAETMISASAAAFVGKLAHTRVEHLPIGEHVSHRIQSTAAILAGKIGGLKTHQAASRAAADVFDRQGEILNGLLDRIPSFGRNDSTDGAHLKLDEDIQWTGEEQQAIADLMVAAFYVNEFTAPEVPEGGDALEGSPAAEPPAEPEGEGDRLDAKNCKRGYSCGNGCISRTKACLKKLGETERRIIKKLKGAARKAFYDGQMGIVSEEERAASIEKAAAMTEKGRQWFESQPEVVEAFNEMNSALKAAVQAEAELADHRNKILDIPEDISGLSQEELLEIGDLYSRGTYYREQFDQAKRAIGVAGEKVEEKLQEATFALRSSDSRTREEIIARIEDQIAADRHISELGIQAFMEAAVPFSQLTGVDLGVENVKMIGWVDDRASYDPTDSYLNMGFVGRPNLPAEYVAPAVGGARGVVYHELSHALDDSRPEIVAASKGFVYSKSDAREAVSMNDLRPDGDYADWERAYPGRFISPYVGKVYPNATEVVSMGIERLSDPFDAAQFMVTHHDHFLFTMGVVATLREENR